MTKKKENPQKGGRPSAYDPKYCEELSAFFDVEPFVEHKVKVVNKDGSEHEKVERLPAELPTFAAFARKLGVHRDTLHKWTVGYPDFSDAFKKAKDAQERILVTNGLCGLYQPAFAIFTAKNIIGWRDKQEVEHTGKVEHTHANAMIGFDAIRQKANTRTDQGSEPTRH